MNVLRSLVFGAALAMAPVTVAMAQVDEGAKAILVESAKAIKESNGVTFTSRRSATGVLKDLIDSNGSVKLLRNGQLRSPYYWIDGRIKQPTKADKKLMLMADGTNVQWLDWDKNVLFERPYSDKEGTMQMKLASQILPAVFVDAEPFQKELMSSKIERLGNETVGGEVCDVVGLTASPGANAKVIWAISAIDRLPRKWTQSTGEGDKAISMMVEVTELKSSPMTAKDFELAMPTNFTKDLYKPAAPVAQGVPENLIPVEKPKLGLDAATALPTFSLTDAAGQTFNNDSVKGKVTVLSFFGTSFKQSTAGLEDLQAISEKYKEQGVKVVGMACRESDEKAPKDLFAARQITYTLVPKADTVLGDLKVSGFPSYYILKPDGTVSSFIQGPASRNELMAAVDAAMAK